MSKDLERVPCLCSKRWLLAYTGFFGFFCLYAMRVNISVAIVCMVQDTSSGSNDTIANNDTSVCEADVKKKSDHLGEFDWNKATQGLILSSFFYGYIVTQVPGGWLAGRFGSRIVLGTGMGLAAVATLLVPVAARWDYRAVIALRILTGLGEGVIFPSMHAMWGRWAPSKERTKLTSMTYAGLNLGNILTFIVSGILCTNGFDNGWGSIFYLIGCVCLVWTLLWFVVASNSPEDHPTISEAERKYIVGGRMNPRTKNFKVPWLSIAKSRGLWVCLTGHVCNNWLHYTLLTGLPTFMKEVHHFDIESNGVLSAVPYISMMFTTVASSNVADFLRSRGYLSTTYTRRIFQAIGFLGSGSCIVGVSFITCERRTIAVVLLALAAGFEGLSYAGCMVNHVDFAPRYAGVLFGITNMMATVPGMLAPNVIGALTPHKTHDEWRRVFYICAALCLLGVIVFGGFAVGEIEPWARPPEEDVIDKEEEKSAKEDKEDQAYINEAFSVPSDKTDGFITRL